MKTKVMVNGLPGKMATEVAKAIIQSDDFRLSPFAFTGENMPPYHQILDKKVMLMGPDKRPRFLSAPHHPSLLSVDYSHPSAVNSNCDFYCENNLPFVMGTTGGNRNALEQRVKDSNIVAVIAPNMAKQIVAFQAMMKYAAETFPNAFREYELNITESHQSGKADTSGTAKAMLQYFNQLGIPFTKDQIKMIRDPSCQKNMGVPEEYLGGHGWHKYTLNSREGDVLFSFTHNVNGRGVYAAGTLDALRFLDKKIKNVEHGKVYSMIDVLKEN